MPDADLTLPVLTMDQFKAQLDAEPDRMQRRIEAGWEVLDAAGIPAPEVEVMAEMFAAMVRAG